MVDGLAGSLGGRTHEDDDALGILSSIVVEEVILTACDLADLLHVVLYNLGHLVVSGVASLTMGEEGLGVLSRTARHGTLRRECAIAEALHVGGVDELCYVLLLHDLDLVVLVRGAETVEEVDERNLRLQRSEVRHSREVHHFLHGTRAEHGETSLTASHHVLMVAEDAERVAGKRTGRDVEDARQHLAGNLVHVRNHEQQALRGGERGSQGTSLQRAVESTSCTTL